MSASSSVDQVIVNTIRTLSMDAVQKANSGHPGAPMGLASVAHTLYSRILRHNPANPDWINRDRFILSAGHASMLLYSCLHLNGYDISLDDIKEFRQSGSITAGHPEFGAVPGVEMTTGPLGQGLATSVGMAIAEKWLAAYFNRRKHQLIDYSIYALGGDGCMMEGIGYEAASLAGHLALDNLVWIYDSNKITIEGTTDLAFSDDVKSRFEACGWHVLHLPNANNIAGFEKLLISAREIESKPTLIIANSHIGFGSPNKQDSASAHGSPLGVNEIKATKEVYGLDPGQSFFVPEELGAYKEDRIKTGLSLEKDWQDKFQAYNEKFPELSQQFRRYENGFVPDELYQTLPEFPVDTKGIATRSSGGKVLNAVAEQLPWLVGGSADLAPSTKTLINASTDFSASDRSGRNLRFGIREHAMGAIVNGLTLSGLRGYGSTFLVFADYMRPAIRLAALMELPSIFIFTHDSIGVGEDGPTHQPIEHLASLRAMPNLDVLRPADANESSVLWEHALKSIDRPSAFILSRQSLPVLDRKSLGLAEGALKGAYILMDSDGEPDVILISTGSEVHLCIEAAGTLEKEDVNVRVVSMPCCELFDRQPIEYKTSVLPDPLTVRIAVEAGSTFGWSKYTLGSEETTVIGINHFGASAPASELFKKFGFSVSAIVDRVHSLLSGE